ncbi:fumarylacetoacetate hydrolase family protein [Peribacillus simplex]|uniref:fumarylacetoacetate hydrolase family protein n=1 Tax=Peribacillus simplex TaxID=1478 RepID=UPI0037FD5BF2
MGIRVVRFEKDNLIQWGLVDENTIITLRNEYYTLALFLEEGLTEARELMDQENVERLSFNEVTLLSPITKPARIICQGANYSSHRAEAGLEIERPPFNMIFNKADSSLTGAYSDVIRPEHVKLLDYEIELGLVISKQISGPIQITEQNLHEYVAGVVMVNDISARDIQLTQSQWLKGKSYRTFCPTGPYLYVLDSEESSYIHDLDIKLWVNDELRQSANTNQLLYKPEETLTELSGIIDLSPGDLVITGTTGGVALNLSHEEMAQLMNPIMPLGKKMNLLMESQSTSQKYLKDGDVIRSEIKSTDEKVNLGTQVNKVVPSK